MLNKQVVSCDRISNTVAMRVCSHGSIKNAHIVLDINLNDPCEFLIKCILANGMAANRLFELLPRFPALDPTRLLSIITTCFNFDEWKHALDVFNIHVMTPLIFDTVCKDVKDKRVRDCVFYCLRGTRHSMIMSMLRNVCCQPPNYVTNDMLEPFLYVFFYNA